MKACRGRPGGIRSRRRRSLGLSVGPASAHIIFFGGLNSFRLVPPSSSSSLVGPSFVPPSSSPSPSFSAVRVFFDMVLLDGLGVSTRGARVDAKVVDIVRCPLASFRSFRFVRFLFALRNQCSSFPRPLRMRRSRHCASSSELGTDHQSGAARTWPHVPYRAALTVACGLLHTLSCIMHTGHCDFLYPPLYPLVSLDIYTASLCTCSSYLRSSLQSILSFSHLHLIHGLIMWSSGRVQLTGEVTYLEQILRACSVLQLIPCLRCGPCKK